MKRIITLGSILILGAITSVGQKINELDMYMNRTVTVDHDTIKIVMGILEESIEIKPDYRLYYYWYKSGDVKRTRGDFSGKILQGSYLEYFPDKSLRMKGEFALGLKNGEWKEWIPNGELVSISNWLKGIKHGIYREFDPEGYLIKEGVYKKGLKQGTWIYYEKEEIAKKVNFKDGLAVNHEQEEISSKKKKKSKRSKKDKVDKRAGKEAGKDDSMTPAIDSK